MTDFTPIPPHKNYTPVTGHRPRTKETQILPDAQALLGRRLSTDANRALLSGFQTEIGTDATEPARQKDLLGHIALLSKLIRDDEKHNADMEDRAVKQMKAVEEAAPTEDRATLEQRVLADMQRAFAVLDAEEAKAAAEADEDRPLTEEVPDGSQTRH